MKRQILTTLIALFILLNNVGMTFAGGGKKQKELQSGCLIGKKASKGKLRKKVTHNSRKLWRIHLRLNKFVKQLAEKDVKKGMMSKITTALGELVALAKSKAAVPQKVQEEVKEWYEVFLPETTKDIILYVFLGWAELMLLIVGFFLRRANKKLRNTEFETDPRVVKLERAAFEAELRLKIQMEIQNAQKEVSTPTPEADTQKCEEASPAPSPSPKEKAETHKCNCSSSPQHFYIEIHNTSKSESSPIQGVNTGNMTNQHTDSGRNDFRWTPGLTSTENSEG